MHRIPAVPTGSGTASRTNRISQPLPQPHVRNDVEVPIAILRVQIICCHNLEAKDRNGYSDPCALAYISFSYRFILIFPPSLLFHAYLASLSSLLWVKNSEPRYASATSIPSIIRKKQRSISQYTCRLYKGSVRSTSSLSYGIRTSLEEIFWARIRCQ